jgi:hypothetical protein
MARSHFNQTIQGTAGDVVLNATIHVYKPETHDQEITDTIYTTRSGVTTRAQGWMAGDGHVDFYLDYAQTVTIGFKPSGEDEQFWENVDVGAPYGDDNVLTYGARPVSGFDNYDAFTEAFTGTMTNGSHRYIPAGVWDVGQTVLYPREIEGWCIEGAGPGGTNRLNPSTIRAKVGSDLPAIMASLEWWSNGSTEDTGQGGCLRNIGFFGGGNGAAFVPTAPETISRTLHGLVLHGSGMKVYDCAVVSANGHGIEMAHFGRDGTTVIGESHETIIRAGVMRQIGRSGIHGGVGQQDGTIDGWNKPQYCGEHGIHLENSNGWSVLNNHPSWTWLNGIYLEKAWLADASHNYVGSVGKFGDGEDVTHYGVKVMNGKGAKVMANRVNTNQSDETLQTDPVTGIYAHTNAVGHIAVSDNSLVYKDGETGVGIETDYNNDTGPASVDIDNIALADEDPPT